MSCWHFGLVHLLGRVAVSASYLMLSPSKEAYRSEQTISGIPIL